MCRYVLCRYLTDSGHSATGNPLAKKTPSHEVRLIFTLIRVLQSVQLGFVLEVASLGSLLLRDVPHAARTCRSSLAKGTSALHMLKKHTCKTTYRSRHREHLPPYSICVYFPPIQRSHPHMLLDRMRMDEPIWPDRTCPRTALLPGPI